MECDDDSEGKNDEKRIMFIRGRFQISRGQKSLTPFLSLP